MNLVLQKHNNKILASIANWQVASRYRENNGKIINCEKGTGTVDEG